MSKKVKKKRQTKITGNLRGEASSWRLLEKKIEHLQRGKHTVQRKHSWDKATETNTQNYPSHC